MYLEALLCAELVNEQSQIKQQEIAKKKPEIKPQFDALKSDCTELLLCYLTTRSSVQNKVILD